MQIQTDSLIIGAGPCGLFQVFELGLLGISSHVIDALPQIGGQCSELYPDKPIYDIPGIPYCTAMDLVDRLLEQIKPFNPVFHLDQQVTHVERADSESFLVRTSKDSEFVTRSVVIAGGVGSFQPMALRVDGIEQLVDSQVFYRVKDPSAFDGKRVVVLGGGDSALDWVNVLVSSTESLTLVHRSEKFRAAEASVQKMKEQWDANQMRFLVGNATGVSICDGEMTEVHITKPTREIEKLPLDYLLVFFGLSPRLGPISEWELELARNQIITDTEKFQSSTPGIYAIGDIATYPGKKKLILSGFHEAALAAFSIKERLNPGEKVHLQYTTTSPLLQKRLGVD